MIAQHCSDIPQPAAIMKSRSRRNLVIALSAAAGVMIACNAAAQERCNLITIGTVGVATVLDGCTLLLDDGHELRLAGIEVTDDSRAALQDFVTEHPLRLERLGPDRDRYVRAVTFAFSGAAEQSV